MEERRLGRRILKMMRAFPLEGSGEMVLESDNVSARGAYFIGDPGFPVGATPWLRMEVGTDLRGKENLFPLCVQVRVARLSRSGDGSVAGFGSEWLVAWSAGDVVPLQEFLRQTLSLNGGFIEKIPPSERGRAVSFVHVFPAAGAWVPPAPPSPRDANAPSSPEIRIEEPLDLDFKTPLPVADRSAISVYTSMPISWIAEEGELEGRTVKMHAMGVRIASIHPPPPVYRKVQVRIPVRQKDKSAFLSLAATVVTSRPSRDPAQEHQFEVQWTLGNDPDTLRLYRKILDRLATQPPADGQ
ncbi:hypothetical protein KBD49_07760 [Myxococcota bacterium]|jgi:hypothetical protein|nr:hypothetical protein [Myxococcota bacterium]